MLENSTRVIIIRGRTSDVSAWESCLYPPGCLLSEELYGQGRSLGDPLESGTEEQA